eukprot:scaffold52625_cov74-Cyclotella_meneghiniana.AAC.3
MHSSHIANSISLNRHEDPLPLPQKHHQRKHHRPHRYNRSSFPCSHPSSSVPSPSSVSSSCYESMSNQPPTDIILNTSNNVSKQSAILLYEAFVGVESKSKKSDVDREPGDRPDEKSVFINHQNYTRTAAVTQRNNIHLNDSVSHNRKSFLNEISGSDSLSDSVLDDENILQRINSMDSNSSTSNQQSVVDDHTQNDEESTNSTKRDPMQNAPSLSSITSLLLSNRKKVGTVLISLASLWLYSKYKQKNNKDRRHNFFITSSSITQQKIHGVCKLLLKLLTTQLSRLRLSSFLRTTGKNRLIGASHHSTAAPNISWEKATAAPLAHLLSLAKAGNISKVTLRGSVISYLHSRQSFTSNDSTDQPKQKWSKTTLPSNSPKLSQEILSTILNHGCDDITTLPEPLWERFLNGPALVIFPFAYLGALFWIMRRLQKNQLDGETDNTFAIDKHNTISSTPNVTFDDVAGIDLALQELKEVVAYIRNPDTFHSIGASPPRGILLYGAPGAGKTLLARAIAGEAGRRTVGADGLSAKGSTINCFAVCSGSDFVETYVGRGAARVRSLFRGVREEAWKNFERQRRRHILVNKQRSTLQDAWGSMHSLITTGSTSAAAEEESRQTHQRPIAIIFIDEIDALAKRRDSGGLSSSLGGCNEREQTLNQLLTEMDGFATGSTTKTSLPGPSGVIVIVIAATNRKQVLDPAILRAGRFDRHVHVPLPDAIGREAILRLHARHIRYDSSSVDFRELAARKENANSSGADLKNVINEAALLAVRSGSAYVQQQHLLEAAKRVSSMSTNNRSHLENGQYPLFFR